MQIIRVIYEIRQKSSIIGVKHVREKDKVVEVRIDKEEIYKKPSHQEAVCLLFL